MREFLYEGKAKKIFSADNPREVVVQYKDDATAGNGVKKGSIRGKGEVNNQVSALLFEMLEKSGIKTHFLKKLNESEQLCRRVEIIKIEVIIRNLIAGSMVRRLNIPEGTRPLNTIYELCYKEDALGDPLINEDHAVALQLASFDELNQIERIAKRVNHLLQNFFNSVNLILVDHKLEFGRGEDGEILLADEISPDTCRLWDKKTGEKLDKDRFRLDLGGIEEAYQEVLRRMDSSSQ